ncbi:hypothetical protein DSM43518_02066 [Mycobacterium marinum]|uniref:hypothetical protein n=1 Tax=Mycobacterium marinum TaxID=1781 RepID=UPI000E3E2199|nr:hypothetical protein [Mycobacterium marinum]RFZ11226.1 hypothetical protein DSM43518_02066 [Mycobacterium marinum]
MSIAVRLVLLLCAFGFAIDAVSAFVSGNEPDAYIDIGIAVLALVWVALIGHLELLRDRRIRDERSRTWARRDKETGL